MSSSKANKHPAPPKSPKTPAKKSRKNIIEDEPEDMAIDPTVQETGGANPAGLDPLQSSNDEPTAQPESTSPSSETSSLHSQADPSASQASQNNLGNMGFFEVLETSINTSALTSNQIQSAAYWTKMLSEKAEMASLHESIEEFWQVRVTGDKTKQFTEETNYLAIKTVVPEFSNKSECLPSRTVKFGKGRLYNILINVRDAPHGSDIHKAISMINTADMKFLEEVHTTGELVYCVKWLWATANRAILDKKVTKAIFDSCTARLNAEPRLSAIPKIEHWNTKSADLSVYELVFTCKNLDDIATLDAIRFDMIKAHDGIALPKGRKRDSGFFTNDPRIRHFTLTADWISRVNNIIVFPAPVELARKEIHGIVNIAATANPLGNSNCRWFSVWATNRGFQNLQSFVEAYNKTRAPKTAWSVERFVKYVAPGSNDA